MNNTDMNKEILLSVEDLVVKYTSNKQIVEAVNGVSFEIEKGASLGLVGETGAGKTSIAKAIIGVLPEFATKVCTGAIYVDGENLFRKKESEMEKIRGNKIAMVFQDPMTALNPVMRIGDQIAEAVLLHENVKKKKAKERAIQMLELVGIPADRYRDYPHQFSGGMKQRVVIAIALACNPELLIADEPTTALDVTIQAQVLEIIKNLRKEIGMALLMISHDLGVVAEVCEKVAVIYAGQIVEFGTIEEVYDHPSHPYTIGLIGALPNIESDSDEMLKPIEGMLVDPTALPKGCKFAARCPYATELCTQDEIPMRHIAGQHMSRCIKMNPEVN